MYYGQPRIRREKSFPITDDFFPQPLLLSQQRLATLREEVTQELYKTLDECHAYQRCRGTYLVNCYPWRAHVEVDGLSEYKRTHRTLANTSESRVFGTLRGNYHDMAQFFHSETRADYFNVQKKLYSYTMDAAVLHNVPQGPESSPLAYEGVKWAVYEPFSVRFRMDSCHFESMGTGIDIHGRPYAYRVILPAAFPEVPDLFKTKRAVRILAKTVMIFMPSERNSNATELFMTMHNNFKSNSVPRSLYKRFLLNLHKIHTHVASHRRPVPRFVLTRHGWVAETQREECTVCTRPFTMLRSKRTCCVCGDTVCRKCVVKSSEIFHAQPLHRSSSRSSRLCTPCIRLLREDQEHAMITPDHSQEKQEDIWAKTPGIHEPLRMSETPTETSYEEVTASFCWDGRRSRSGSNASSHSNYDYQSESAPTTPMRPRRSHLSFSSHRLSTSSSASDRSTTSHRLSRASLSSPIAVVGGPNEEIEYIDDEAVIYEEDPDLLSQRSTGVVLTVDTSEMERVRGDSDVFSTHSSGGKHSRSASMASVGSEEMLHSISSSLHEQEQLLRQLQAATQSFRRTTRGASVVA